MVACSWCQKVLRVVPTTDARMAGRVSHGICADCNERVRRDLAALKKKNGRAR